MTTPLSEAVLNGDPSKAGIFDSLEFPPIPLSGGKKRRVVQLQRRPPGPNTAESSQKEAVTDEKSKEVLLSEEQRLLGKEMKLLRNFQASIRKLQESDPQNLTTLLRTTLDHTERLCQEVAVWKKTLMARDVEAARTGGVEQVLRTSRYAFKTAVEQEEIEKTLSDICQGPTYTELRLKYLQFALLINKLKTFKGKVESEKSKITDHNFILNAKTTENIDFPKLKCAVESILENRKALLSEAMELQTIVQQAYKQLRTVISNFVEIYGDKQFDSSSIFFVQSAALNNKTKEEEIATYNSMYDFIQKLKGQVKDFETTWALITETWKSNKDAMRKLSFINQEKRIPWDTIVYREYAVANGFDVTTFHFEKIQGVDEGFFATLTKWAYPAPVPESSSGPSSSSQ